MSDEIINFDFGNITCKYDHVAIIEINSGIEVDEDIANKIISRINDILKQPSVLIVNKKFDYSYTTDGMKILNDANLPNVLATAIVVHNSSSEVMTKSQVDIMKCFGRSNIQVFNNEESAMTWAQEILESE